MSKQLLSGFLLLSLCLIVGCNSVIFVKKDKIIRKDYGFTVYSTLPGEEFFVVVKDSSYLRNVENIFDSGKLKKGFSVGMLPGSNKVELAKYATAYTDMEFEGTILVIPSFVYYSFSPQITRALGKLDSTKPVVYPTEKREIKFNIEEKSFFIYSIRPFGDYIIH